MIKFEQVQGGSEGGPKDIVVTTDDENAELALMDDAFNEAAADDMQTYDNLRRAQPSEDGLTRFTIPGGEAGEVADIFDLEDQLPLSAYLEELNDAALAAAEENAGE